MRRRDFFERLAGAFLAVPFLRRSAQAEDLEVAWDRTPGNARFSYVNGLGKRIPSLEGQAICAYPSDVDERYKGGRWRLYQETETMEVIYGGHSQSDDVVISRSSQIVVDRLLVPARMVVEPSDGDFRLHLERDGEIFWARRARIKSLQTAAGWEARGMNGHWLTAEVVFEVLQSHGLGWMPPWPK